MSSLKTFDIRLTDIWIECQKELIEMRDKIIDLKTCLRTSEKINKHLIKCNEVLVAIIEKCKIDNNNNKGMNDLIKTIKCEEECIEVEKQNLKKVKEQIHSDFNEHNVIKLIADWNHSKSPKNFKQNKLIEEKSTQTPNKDIPIDSNSANSEREVTIDLNQIISKLDSVLNSEIQTICETKDSETFEQIIGFDENDNRSDASVKSDDFDINDNESDSDFEVKTQNNKRGNKSNSKTTLRTKKINSIVMPYSVGDQYVCTRDECQFVCKVKRQFYRHLRSDHNIDLKFRPKRLNNMTEKQIKIRKNIVFSAKTVRINEAILPYKVGEDYICTKVDDCLFTSSVRNIFYNHLRGHDPKPQRKYPREEKSNNSERPYVCDWPTCSMAFRRPQHLSIHRNRHLGKRDYVCDWPGCGAEMYTSHNYYTHRLTHTDERPWKCDWPGCTYSCKQKWALVAHKRIHTGEKPYLCPFPECGYRCSQPCTLVSHKRKHTGEKPYSCEAKGCNKQFSALAGLWSHRKIHARKDTLQFSIDANKSRAKITKSPQKSSIEELINSSPKDGSNPTSELK